MEDEFKEWHRQLVQQEKLVRNAAIFGFNESIGGFELVPLTLEKWTALAVMESPYLPPFREPEEGETVALLWLLSPLYVPESHPEAKARRAKFYKQKFAFVAPMSPLFAFTLRSKGKHIWKVEQARQHHEIIATKIREYINEALQDAPTGGGGGLERPEYYCDAVATASTLARAFGGGVERYLTMPLKLVFQLVKANSEFEQIEAGVPVILHNSSDVANDAEMEAVNRNLHASGAKMHPDAVSWFAKNNSQN
jgi:hypothetical protein